ncbi:putative ribonuclease H-like domain-containing protein [Tanacetum coccineum]
MNYVPVVAGNQTNGIAGTRDNIVAGQAKKKTKPEQEYILIPFCITDPLISQGPKDSEENPRMKPTEVDVSRASDKDGEDDQATRINAAKTSEEHLFEQFSPFKNAFSLPDVPNVFSIDDTGIFGNAYDDEDVGAEADLNNLETTMNVSPIPTTRIDKDHPKDQIIRDLTLAIQTWRMTKIYLEEHCLVSYINKQRRTNHKDYQNYLFACFLSQKEPKKVIQSLEDPSWIEAMQEELLQFEFQKVWTLVDLPNGKRAIGTKCVFKNKKYERGIVVRNKARLVAQGYTQEEGIDYDKMDVKSAFLYGNIEEEVLWIQNQMLDYGFNFMNTKIYIDNESTICIVKNPKFHAKTKHIEIRHHFIRDSYEKRLIQVIKVHSDQNVANLLTKAFDVSRLVIRLSIRSWVTEWKGLPLLLLAEKQSKTVMLKLGAHGWGYVWREMGEGDKQSSTTMRYTRHKRMINGDAGIKNGIFISRGEKIWRSNGIREKRKKDPYNISERVHVKISGEELSKVLVSSKKRLRDVEEDLVITSEDGADYLLML